MRRIQEGAAMIRTKGEAGTGNIVEAVNHIRTVNQGIDEIVKIDEKQLQEYADSMRLNNIELLNKVKELKRLPVVNFAAGGIATPADAALCMQLGCDGVFVGSGIFKSNDPARRAKAIVEAVAHYTDAELITKVSTGLGDCMPSLDIRTMDEKDKMASRGE